MDRHELLASSRDRYVEGFQHSVELSLNRSLKGLVSKADRSVSSIDQARYLAARGILQRRASDLRLGMHSAMDRLLTRSLETTYSAFRPPLGTDILCEDLALVENSELENELRIVKLTERFRNEAEAQVRDLNVRIALLFDQEKIKERENPFRPYLISRSITDGIENASVLPELVPVLIAELAEQMAAEVEAIYASVNSHLARHGVSAKLQKVIKLPSYSAGDDPDHSAQWGPGAGRRHDARYAPGVPVNGVGVPGGELEAATAVAAQRLVERLIEMVDAVAAGANLSAAPADAAGGMEGAAGGGNSNRHKVACLLRGLFHPREDPRAATAIAAAGRDPQGVSAELTTAVDHMVRDRTPAAPSMLDGSGAVRNLLLEQRGELAAKSGQAIEQTTIDVVAMLFEFILHDGQVPADVRVQLGRLQFLVLKVALQDQTLLSQTDHPARELINRIGSVAVGLKLEEPGGARIGAEIHRVVETLLQDASGDPGVFSRLLGEFDSFLDSELRRADENVERAIQAAENAQARAANLAAEGEKLEQALSGLTLDPLLREFLSSAWVTALERSGHEEAGKAAQLRSVVPDLLWSILAKTHPQDRATLLGLLPGLLDALHEGLDYSDWGTENKRRFFEWLMSAHTMALRSRIDASPAPALLAIRQHFESYTEGPAARPAPLAMADSPADFGKFLEQEIEEIDVRIQLLDRLLDDTDERPLDGRHDDGSEAGAAFEPEIEVLERLRNGIAIEISVGGAPSIGTLNWVDRGVAHMVLTLDGHGEAAIVSVRMFMRMIRSGRVHFLESAPLFERAVASLLESAEQHDEEAA